jgi:hypothetical protein
MVKVEYLGVVVETSQDLGGSQEKEKKNKDILLLVCLDPATGNKSVMRIRHAFRVQNCLKGHVRRGT